MRQLLYPFAIVLELLMLVVAVLLIIPLPSVARRIVNWSDKLPDHTWYSGSRR